ncbi:PREDICTED: uncharacterized protein LOC106809298 [Priapulus caudatus]|uniref:Uncharacterized protein LOC106809298 n=1 Tax=Priapulus caudatus TaxID=37621 RepID=A0ABM1E6K4_PRICU|nr:PREDICTED: uncharacterized protein LOC106809298 [Priapulus caudatus]XP_014667825.1 PREDICTED: uncharacterized protein LOC106809298 [Priapulus caudatus]
MQAAFFAIVLLVWTGTMKVQAQDPVHRPYSRQQQSRQQPQPQWQQQWRQQQLARGRGASRGADVSASSAAATTAGRAQSTDSATTIQQAGRGRAPAADSGRVSAPVNSGRTQANPYSGLYRGNQQGQALVKNIIVKCLDTPGRKLMEVTLEMSNSFWGSVYTARDFGSSNCRARGTGSNYVRLYVPFYGCSTRELVDRQRAPRQRKFVNNIVVQNSPNSIVAGTDKAYPVSCTLRLSQPTTTTAPAPMPLQAQVNTGGLGNRFSGYGNVPIEHLLSGQHEPFTNYDQGRSFNTYNNHLLGGGHDEHTDIKWLEDDADFNEQHGGAPLNEKPDPELTVFPGVSGSTENFFTVGQPATVLVEWDNTKNWDVMIRNCYAHDGRGQYFIKLIDDMGCARHDLTGAPLYLTNPVRDFGFSGGIVTRTIDFNFFSFRFPSSDTVYFHCETRICEHACVPGQCFYAHNPYTRPKKHNHHKRSADFNETLIEDTETTATRDETLKKKPKQEVNVKGDGGERKPREEVKVELSEGIVVFLPGLNDETTLVEVEAATAPAAPDTASCVQPVSFYSVIAATIVFVILTAVVVSLKVKHVTVSKV